MAENVIRQDVIQLDIEVPSIKELDKLKKELDGLKKGLKGGIGDDAFDDFKKSTEETVKPLSKLKEAVKNVGNAILDIGKKAAKVSFKAMLDGLKKIASVSLKGITSSLQKIASISFKTVVAGLGAAAVAVGGLVGKAVQAYADFEQLKGGVETLFGAKGMGIEEYAQSVGKSVSEVQGEYDSLMRAQDTVLTNANNAYKTAGLSANEYMETVTSFSASLISSVGGDTEKAAKIADMAIIDMADNANKMGTDIGSIQMAYQGFAKQNYTMLDNLKLGYGGTKEEMQRLLAEASKISGIKYDISNLNDVYEAIHVVQNEMGITGATQKEAEKTVTGSLNAMKASWGNLLTAIGSGENLDQCMDNMVASVETFGKNVIPVAERALGGVVQVIETLAPKIVEALPNLLNQALPQIANAATGIVSSLGSVLPQIVSSISSVLPQIVTAVADVAKSIGAVLPQIIESLVATLPQVVQGIGELLPYVIEGITTLIVSLANALPSLMQTLVDALPSAIQAICDALPTIIPALIDGIVNAFVILTQNISAILQPIIDSLPNIIISIVNAIMSNLPAIIQGLITLTLAIVQAIPQIIQALIDALPTVISSIISGLLGCLPQLISGLIELVLGIVVALPQIFASLVEGILGIFTGIWDGICQSFSGFGDFFGGIWNTLTEGASNAWQGVCDVFSGVATFFGDIFRNAWEGVKKVFSAGGKIFDGIKEGIVTAFKTVVNGIIKGINKVVAMPFKGLNNVLDKIHGIEIAGIQPFGWLTWRAPVPQIPLLANGGLLTEPTLNVAGEAGDEMVIPLSRKRRRRGLDLWLQAGEALGVKQYANGGIVENNYSYQTSYSTYTPESDYGGSTTTVAEYNTYSPNFTLNISGTGDDRAMARKVKAWIAEALEDMFDTFESKNPQTQEV